MDSNESRDVRYSLLDLRSWLRVGLGLAVMAAALLGLALLGGLIGWAVHQPVGLSRWRDPGTLVELALVGLLAGLPVLFTLWIVGGIAFSIGNDLIPWLSRACAGGKERLP